MSGTFNDPDRIFIQSAAPEFVVTSFGRGWADSFFAEVRRTAPFEGIRTEHRHTHLCIQSYGVPARQRRLGAGHGWRTRGKGSCVWLPGDEQFGETSAEAARNRFLFVSEDAVARILGEPFDPRRFAAFHGQVTALSPVQACLSAIALDLRAGSPAGRIFAECQIAGVVSWLAQRGEPAATARREPQLTGAQISRLYDLIDARLAGELSLCALATEFLMPLKRFRAAISATLGKSPTRVVHERRILKAKRLMASTSVTLANIAAECGFADQAHMCRMFQREVGASPSAWRSGSVH